MFSEGIERDQWHEVDYGIGNTLIFLIFLFRNFTFYPRYSNVNFSKASDVLRLEEKLGGENFYRKLISES